MKTFDKDDLLWAIGAAYAAGESAEYHERAAKHPIWPFTAEYHQTMAAAYRRDESRAQEAVAQHARQDERNKP